MSACEVVSGFNVVENFREFSRILENFRKFSSGITDKLTHSSPFISNQPIVFYFASRWRAHFQRRLQASAFSNLAWNVALAISCGEVGAPAKLAYDGAPWLSAIVWHAKPTPRQIFSFFS